MAREAHVLNDDDPTDDDLEAPEGTGLDDDVDPGDDNDQVVADSHRPEPPVGPAV